VKKCLLLLSLLILAKPVLPLVEYVANYDYISKVLCVNKATPASHCNGKCHLMKELAKASENEKPISDKKLVVHESETLFFQEIRDCFTAVWFTDAQPENTNLYHNLYAYLNSTATFHPPTFIS
jgi:hypothetical protein